jgi:hypothetical protein
MVQLYRRLGGETVVNTQTANNQITSAIAQLASGGFVVVWTSQQAAGQIDYLLKAQFYASDGSKSGAELTLGSTETAGRVEPSVAALPSGGFVVSWTYDTLQVDGQGAPLYQLQVQVYDSAGAPAGALQTMPQQTAGSSPDSQIAVLADGSFVVSWTQRVSGSSEFANVVAQRFDAAGVPVGSTFTVHASTLGGQQLSGIAALAGGGFVVTWADGNTTGTADAQPSGVKARLYESDGDPVGAEFLVNTSTLSSQSQPAIAPLADGGFVIVWTDFSGSGGDSSGSSIKGQRYDSAGTKVGGEFLVNTATAGHQQSATVEAGPGGGFMVAWTDFGTPTGAELKGQLYDSAGARLGVEFQLNSVTAGSQGGTQLTATAGGGFAAVWTDAGGSDGNASGIKLQLFAPGSPAPTDIALAGATVSETAMVNSVVGTLSATGAVNSGFSYEILSDSSGGGFRIDGDKLVVDDNVSLDFESAASESVRIRVTDEDGQSYVETFAISVTDVAAEQRFAQQPAFLAHSSQAGLQGGTQTVALAGGGFALIWNDLQMGAPDPDRVYIRFYDAAGAPVSGEIVLAGTWFSDMEVTPLAGGGLLIASLEWPPAPEGWGVRAQRFDSTGQQVGPDMIAGRVPNAIPNSPNAVELAGGGFVLSWISSPADVYAQRFDAAGNAVGSPILVNAVAGSELEDAALVALPSGGFAISWIDAASHVARLQIFEADGDKIGGEVEVSFADGYAATAELVVTSDGNLALAWAEYEGTALGFDGYTVYAQRLTAAGVKLGDPVETAAFVREEGDDPAIVIAADARGGFVLGWSALDPSTGFASVYTGAQIVTAAGERVGGGEFRVGDGAQAADLAVLPDGTIVFGWTAGDSDDLGAYGGLFTRTDVFAEGTAASETLTGTAGADRVRGLGGHDFFRMEQGGDDRILGEAGNDVFLFGATLTAADRVDGGAGTDQIAIQGDYAGANALTLGAGVVRVENLAILPGSDTRFGDPGTNSYDYDLTTLDSNVAAGVQMVVDANRLQAGEDFTFDGSAETDGSFFLYGGRGTDLLTGGARNDVFYFGEGLQFGAADKVVGGAGIDQLGLRGNYTIVFGADQLQGIEAIGLVSAQDTRFGPLGASYSYDLTMHDGNVAAGVRFIVDAAAVRGAETLTFDGSAETDGSFRLFGGAGNDRITGSQGDDILFGRAGDDWIKGGLGADTIAGDSGSDSFVYAAFAESTAAARDTLNGFAVGSDKIDLAAIDAVSGGPDDSFTWIGASAFSGVAGQLRSTASGAGWLVEGDVDGDGAADLVILVNTVGSEPLGPGDFVF